MLRFRGDRLHQRSDAAVGGRRFRRLVARFHRAGVDHADLNAHNLLFNPQGKGWMIDFDRGALRIPATRWRENNLMRLQRSLLKLRDTRSREEVMQDFARLRRAYDIAWQRGF